MICTFYSFKGGVGRSMALANIAELLYRQGQQVLIVDFDLEAPGLERFFEVPEVLHSPDEVMSARGMVDMLLSYKDLCSLPQPNLPRQEMFEGQPQNEFPFPVEPLTNFIVPLYEENFSGGSLAIIPAGRRDDADFTRYANQVRSFDWNDFYTNWNGEQFFEWFRREAEARFDVILIDSRTGVTEMGGVCNYQLADIVILFVAPNQQNIDGTVRIAQSLTDPKLIEEGRNGRPLSLVFMPSRIEHGEKALLDNFERQFNRILDSFPTPQLTFEKSAFIDLKIPYVPYFAYTENVAVREVEHASASDLVTAFRNLVSALAKLAPVDHRLKNLLPGLRKVPKGITVLPLPPAASGLVGREKEQAWLESCIFASKVVEVSGMGGVGKTTLVADTITKVQDRFRGGIAVVLANEITDPLDIVRQLIEKFIPYQQELLSRPGVKPSLLYDALKNTLVRQREDGSHVLIVLDNVEPRLVQSEGLKQLCDIFRSTQVSVIMTTRTPLSAQLVHEGLELKPLTNKAASYLLTRLLEEHSLKRFLTDSEKRDAAEICELVGNHAQAIVLIAAYFEGNDFESLADYLQRLRERPQIVLDLVDRLQDVRTSSGIRITFASSYTKLPVPAQRLFIALGAPAGRGCTFRAIVALGTALKQSEDETRANLAVLRRSRLTLEPVFDIRGNARINLHPLVQEFARELLRTSSDISKNTLDEILALHYVEWVQKVDEELLEADDANITAALKWAKAHPSQESKVALAQLIYHLRWYWYSRFRFEEAFEWLKVGCDAMELLGTDYDEMRGALLFAMGTQYQQTGEIADAEQCYQKSYEIFDEISKKDGLKAGLGEALSGLAALFQQRGQSEEAQQYYERSLAIFRELQDQRGEANALLRLGFLALRTGDTDAAERYYADSLKMHLELQDRWGEGTDRYSLGDVYQQIGQVDKARDYYEQGLAICRKVHNRRGEGAVLKSLGDLALQTTGPTEAERYLSQSLAIFREIFDPQSQGVTMYSLAFLFRQAGRIEDARSLYTASLEIRERVKDERGRGFVLKGLGDLTRRTALHAKDMLTAKMQLEVGLTTSRKVKDRRNQGVALKALGDWYWQVGDTSTARESYEQSLVIRRDFHELRGEAITLKALGDLSLREHDHVTAQKNLERSYVLFLRVKDLRGQGVTLHSLGILAWEQNDKSTARTYFDQSLDLLRLVQDRQFQGSVLYTLALWADAQKKYDESEKWYRESLQIATEVQAANSIALSREGLGDFLARRYGQRGRGAEGDSLLVGAAEIYELLGRPEDVQRTEELRTGRNREHDKDKLVRVLIYDLDEGPNAQGFALSNEKRSVYR